MLTGIEPKKFTTYLDLDLTTYGLSLPTSIIYFTYDSSTVDLEPCPTGI